MARALTLVLLLIACSPALAQDVPRCVKTETIHNQAPGMSVLYTIEANGSVRIDWDAVETL